MATSYKDLLSGNLDNTEEQDTVASPAPTEKSRYARLLSGETDTIDSDPEKEKKPVLDPNLSEHESRRLESKKIPELPDIPTAEAWGSILKRGAQSIAQGTGDIARAASMSREHLDKPEYMVDRNLDWAHMTPVEQAQAAQKFQGKTEEEIRELRIQQHIDRRDEFIAAGQKFAEWMPEVEAKKTNGALGFVDDVVTGMSRFLPTMVGGAVSGGALAFPLAYMQILPGKYDDYVKHGVEKERAFNTAQAGSVALALVEGLGTNIQLSKMAGAFGKGAGKKSLGGFFNKFLDQVVANGATEGFEELTQGEVEVLFDVYAKNPNATPEQMGDQVIQIWKDPVFQKEKLYEAVIGVAGGAGMGAGASVTARVVNGPDPDNKTPRQNAGDDSGNKTQAVPSGQPGVTIEIPDVRRDTDVKEDAESVPSVESLMGVAGDPSVSTPDGVSVSGDLNVTDEQRTEHHQSTDSIKQILGELAGEQAMDKHRLDIEVSKAKIDSFVGFYNDMVVDGDAQGGLQMAQMMEQETNIVIDNYTKLQAAATARATNKKMLPDPDLMEAVEAEKVRIKKQSDDRVKAQTALVHAEQQQQRQEYIDTMNTVDGLQTELIGATNVANRENQPKIAKLYNNVVSEMRFRQASGNLDYFSKTPMKKLVDLEVQATLIAQENKANPNVDANVIERDNAINRWIKQQQSDRIEYDQVQLVGDRAILTDKVDQAIAAEKVEATQKAEAKPAVKAVERRRANEATGRKAKERKRISKIGQERQKAKGVVADQRAEVRKPIPGPTRTEELKAVKEDKAKRESEIKKQVQRVEGLERPKAPIKKGKAKVSDLKKDTTNFAILTSDNPQSPKTTTPAQNVQARSKLIKKLDDLGIDYTIGKSKFEGSPEVPFVIHNINRSKAQKLAKELNQSSFIVAEGKKLHFIEGGDVNTVNRADLKKAPDATDFYTEINGEKFKIPFFEDASESSILDTVMMQIDPDVAPDAKRLFRAAGIRYAGEVFEGHSHMQILIDNGRLDKLLFDKTFDNNKLEDGFVTHDGEFVSRNKATELIGKKGGEDLYSEDFLRQAQAQSAGMTVVDFDTMTLKDQMGTLDLMEELQNKMKTGPYSFLFDKTKAGKTKTIFVTQPGQYGKIQEVIKVFPNLKARDNAIGRFEGQLRGVYLPTQDTAIINLPGIMKRKGGTVDRAFETVVHEHVHAAHKIAFSKMTKEEGQAFGKELNNIWLGIDPNFIRQQRDDKNVDINIRAGIGQITTDINELVSYSMSHPEFAAWLDSIPASPRFRAKSGRIKTMWDALVNLIVKKSLKAPTKLDEVMDVLNGHLNLGKPSIRASATDIDLTTFDFGANVTEDMAKEWAGELDASAVNALPTRVAVDKKGMEDMLGFDVADNVEAIWTEDGDLIIRADMMESKEHLVTTWMHEQVAHQGLRNIFGDNTALFNRFLDQSFTLFSIKQQEDVVNMARMHGIFVGTDKAGKPIMKLKKGEKRLVAEEMIARMAGRLKPVTQKGIIKRFGDFLKRWLPGRFTDVKADFILNEKDIWDVIASARENVFTGSTKFGDALNKAVSKRRPTVKSKGWKNIPDFMETDETYLEWAAETVKAAPNLKEWYSEHQETIRENFGKDGDIFQILLAITSPQADVEINVQYAINTYAYLMGLRDMPGGRYPNVVKKRIDEKWTSPDAMLANLESPNFKVTEFGRALLGDTDATVGDLWMYRLFYGDPATTGNRDAETYTKDQITGLRQKLHSLAAQMSKKTGETWTAREMQAALWVNINAKQTGKDISKVASYQSGLNRPTEMYGGKTPLEYLNSVVPNLADGPLSDVLGISNIPLAPISPLAKWTAFNIGKDVKGKYPVSETGVIRVLDPGMSPQHVARISNAIVAGGRELTAADEDMATWYQKTFGFEKIDGGLDMRLSDIAIDLYSDKKGKLKANLLRDNLGGFSGNYTRAVRFSKAANNAMSTMASINSTEADNNFLNSNDDPKQSYVGQLHEWRDQAELNVNRFTAQIEQEFLEKFGGRKSRIKGVGSGRYLHTAKSEIMAKALNLYIDSGQAADKLAKVHAFRKTLLNKKRTPAETEKLRIIDTMLNLSAGAQAWARETIQPQYDNFFKFAQKHGIIDSYVEDYVKRTWAMPDKYKDAGIVWDGTGATGFKTTTSSGKQRSFNSIIDGWVEGMELKSEGVLGNLQTYANEIGYVFANRRFTDYLKSLVTNNPDGVIAIRDNEQNPPVGMVRVQLRGLAAPGKVVYARTDIGKELNRLGLKASAIWETPGMVFTRKLNSVLKSTLLSVSMFHHLAGVRSYVFGVRGAKGLDKIRPFKAYREGLRKMDQKEGFDSPNYQHLGPIVDLLVGQGLTIGKTQDWEEQSMFQSWIEQALQKSNAPGAEMALTGWQGMRRAKRQWTNGLFGQLFAGLKAQSAAVELTREITKMEKKLNRGLTDTEIKTEAEKVARLINADFGGLHLKRMGRHPDWQMAAQLLMLAPDWTESNWRTVTGMVPGGINNKIDKLMGGNVGPKEMSKVYRRFWLGIALKGVATVAAAQFAVLALFGDDEDRKEYKNQMSEALTREGFAKGRWASVDVTPVLDAVGFDTSDGKRQDLNVLGHFKDILKIATPVSLAKHKISPVAGSAESLISATDWKGDRFKSIEEWMKADDWSLTADKYKDPRDPDGIWPMAAIQQRIVAGVYNVRKAFPIPLNEVMQAVQGESSWMAALPRGLGVDIRDVRHKDPNEAVYWKKSQEVKRLERALSEAKLVRDNRMITAARQDIKGYDNFNRTKARLGFARTRLNPINKKIRALESKMDKGSLTVNEIAKLRKLKQRKADIYRKFVDVIGR